MRHLLAVLVSLLAALPGSGHVVAPVPSAGVVTAPRPVFAPGGTHIMPLGDSITAGFRSSSGAGYEGPLLPLLPAGWVTVGSQSNGGIPDEGHSQYTIAQVRDGFSTWFATNPAQWILLDAGTNDAKSSATYSVMLTLYENLLAVIHQVAPSARVVVAQVTISTGLTAAQQQAEAQFDYGLLPLAAREGAWVRVVDMRGVELSPDGLHPDDAGYQAMAARWWSVLGPWIGAV